MDIELIDAHHVTGHGGKVIVKTRGPKYFKALIWIREMDSSADIRHEMKRKKLVQWLLTFAKKLANFLGDIKDKM
nr:hypothetical protein [Tanacetum cinerariifolium]